MRRLLLLFLVFSLFVSCKKDKVDASTTKSFQESINDMTSSLPTLKQIKFNEALYMIKTFGVEGNNEFERIKNLGILLNGMNVQQIMAKADEVARKNSIAWSSTGPPSLGEMNIFGDEKATESDPNDIKASSLGITAVPTMKDSIAGAKAIQVIPRLLDSGGNPVVFSNAGLETVLEVFSNGVRLLTSKNMMQDNNFRGFTLKLASLPKDKVVDNKIDITVSVKTTDKTFKMSKIGVPVNPKALYTPPVSEETTDAITDEGMTEEVLNSDGTTETQVAGDPKTTVTRFLNQLSAQNFKGAYDASDNPSWGSYDNFSNPTSGFGSVKSISVKNISPAKISGNTSSVNATYDVKDKNGNTTSLHVTFGLKNENGQWKISSYKIN